MKRRTLLWTIVLLLVILGLPALLVYRQVRQERLDAALYAALSEGNPERALELLRQGADPNSLHTSAPTPTLWETLLKTLRIHPDASTPKQERYASLHLAFDHLFDT